MEERYYAKLAAAAIRRNIIRMGREDLLGSRLASAEIDELLEEELDRIIDIADSMGLTTYYFKKSERLLPRVNIVLGFLKSICFDSLLDVGSGRGAFLFPFLEKFPHVRVTATDILTKWYQLLSDVSLGGISRLTVLNEDICSIPFPEKSVDAVTMLEVLEHIPDTEAAVSCAVKMAREFVLVTVPSREDDNPEHIHLFTRESLTDFFIRAGAKKISFDEVPGHLFMIARV